MTACYAWHGSFPLNRIANFFELNQIASSGCSNQTFAWSNQNAGSCYRVNRNLDLPISAIHRRTAGLSWAVWMIIYQGGVPTRRVTYPSTNWAQCKVTSLIEINTLPLSQFTTNEAEYHRLRLVGHLACKKSHPNGHQGLLCKIYDCPAKPIVIWQRQADYIKTKIVSIRFSKNRSVSSYSIMYW